LILLAGGGACIGTVCYIKRDAIRGLIAA
jgi:hypothetical protein